MIMILKIIFYIKKLIKNDNNDYNKNSLLTRIKMIIINLIIYNNDNEKFCKSYAKEQIIDHLTMSS